MSQGRGRDPRELVSRALSGDTEAIERLRADNDPLVRGIVARFLEDPCDVDDCVQELWELLLLREPPNLRHYDALAPLSSWLAVVARRHAGRWLRRLKRRRARELSLEALELGGFEPRDGASPYETRESIIAIGECLSRINERYGDVLRRKSEGLTDRELSGVFGLSTESVPSLVMRARRALTQCLQHDEGQAKGGDE